MKNIKLKVLLLVAICGIFGAMFGQSAWATLTDYTFVYPRPKPGDTGAATYTLKVKLDLDPTFIQRHPVNIDCSNKNEGGPNAYIPITISQNKKDSGEKSQESVDVIAKDCGKVKEIFVQELNAYKGTASGNTGGNTGGSTGGTGDGGTGTGGTVDGGTGTGGTGTTGDTGAGVPKKPATGATILTGCWNEAKDSEDGRGIKCILTLVVDVLTVGIGVLGVLGITIVGIQYLTAGGSEEQTRKAKRRLFEIIIGLVAYVLIYALLKFLMPNFG